MRRIRATENRVFCFLTTAVILCLLTPGCSPTGTENAPADISEKEAQIAREEERQLEETERDMEKTAANEILTWVTDGIDKIREDTGAPESRKTEYSLRMAKNEAEGCQVAFRASRRFGSVSFVCTEADDGAPALSIYREHTLKAGGGYYPDPLSPFSGKLTLLPDSTASLCLRFTSTKDTKPGEYTYRFVLLADGEAAAEVTVRVRVWNFALPDHPSSATAVGLYKSHIAKMHPGTDGAELDELYAKYYEKLLEYKVSAYDMPYDILDDRADAVMSDPRVTSFRVPVCEGDDDTLEAICHKLRGNPDWLAKAYFYPLDEPTSGEKLDLLAEMCRRLHAIAPDIRVCTPFFLNIDYDADTDQISFMTGKTTLWCPKSYMFVTSNIYSEAQMKKYPAFGERMAERKAAGDGLWWYVCWEPGDPYNNLFVDQKGIQHRLLFWQQYKCGVDGFLYWGANYWGGTENPWEDMATVKDLSTDVYGDGSLLYNGSYIGLNDACGSLRLEITHDGIEDFELLKLAEERFGRAWVEDQVKKITASLTQYVTDTERFLEVRDAIGNALSD